MEEMFISLAAFLGAGCFAVIGVLLVVSGGINVLLSIPFLALAVGLFVVWVKMVQGEFL